MKKTNKLFSVVLAIVLVFAMAIPAFAAETGSITISNAASGETYSAYQMLTFTPVAEGADAGIYKVADGWADFFAGAGAAYFNIAADGAVTLKDGADRAALAVAAIAYAKDKTATKTATAAGSEVVLADLPLGYYAVDTTLGTICALTNTNSDVTAIEKNEGPALEKKIVEGEALVDANTAAIGDTVTYQATITIGEGVQDYEMHDKVSGGLTDVKVTSVQIAGVDVVADNYTVTSTGLTDGCTFEIAFKNDYTEDLAKGTKIVVTYTATVDTDAVVGSTGNPNEAWLEFNTGDEVRTTPVDTVITYTTKITVNKTDKDGNALAGAGFTLYKKNADGKYVAVGSELKGDGMTTFVWNGLDEGEYKIVETTVPAGYNKADDVEFTISATVPKTVTATTDTATWKAGDAELTNGVYATDIENLTGGLLPETGGIGTTIFYIVGAILVVGAAILLITKKRMSVEA